MALNKGNIIALSCKAIWYLGHVLTENFCDDSDKERGLAVRCHTLARKFVKCLKDVKV